VPDEWRPRLRRLAYKENVCGVNVYRTWLWPLPNRKSHERIRNYSSFCISAALCGLMLPRPDIIIATSPQLLVGLSGWWIAFAREIPFVFEVRDLWPESLVAVGMDNGDSVLHHTLSGIAGFLYDKAKHIVVVSPAFKERLVEDWRIPPKKISTVVNGVESDLFIPQSTQQDEATRKQLGLEGKFVVCYIGTMGMAHGLETLLAAAEQLHGSSVAFLLVGEGAEKERVKSLAQSRGITNVHFLDQQPREKIPALISASNACLVLLKKTDVFKTVIPTKMLEFMSCARPVILGVEGQAKQIIEEAQSGLAIPPESPSALANAITRLENDDELCRALGEKGRSHILERYSRASTAEKYVHLLSRILKEKS